MYIAQQNVTFSELSRSIVGDTVKAVVDYGIDGVEIRFESGRTLSVTLSRAEEDSTDPADVIFNLREANR